MNKFEVKKTITLSIPVSFQRELAEFAMILEEGGLDFYLTEIIETIINKAPKTDKFEIKNYSDIADRFYVQYREGE